MTNSEILLQIKELIESLKLDSTEHDKDCVLGEIAELVTY